MLDRETLKLLRDMSRANTVPAAAGGQYRLASSSCVRNVTMYMKP